MVIYRGGDYYIERTLTNDGTTAINIGSLSKIFINIIHKRTKELVSKYQYPTVDGYEPIEIVDAASGEIKFLFQSEETTTSKIGNYEIEYMLRYSDADYDGSTKDVLLIEDYDRVKDTIIKSE